MTDKEIGKTAREIAERGNTLEVKREKGGATPLFFILIWYKSPLKQWYN